MRKIWSGKILDTEKRPVGILVSTDEVSKALRLLNRAGVPLDEKSFQRKFTSATEDSELIVAKGEGVWIQIIDNHGFPGSFRKIA